MNENLETKQTADPDKPVRLGRLADLETLTRQTGIVTLPYKGKLVELEIRSLTPEESARFQAMQDEIRPPLVPNQDPDKEPSLNYGDPEFLRRATASQLKVRALCLYLVCPAFRKEGLAPEEIPAHVQSLLSDRLLETLWKIVRQDCTVMAEDEAVLGARVHFTSPAS